MLNLRQLLYHFSVLVKPQLGFLAKLAKRTRHLIIFHKSRHLSPNAMKGIPKGAGNCLVFPVAINTDGSAATQGRQQCKIFSVPVSRERARESSSGQNHVKSKSEAEDSLPPAGGKSKSSVKLPAGVTMTLGDATCHPVPESGNHAWSLPFASVYLPLGYIVCNTLRKKKKWRKASV